jgi:hypothetical protein
MANRIVLNHRIRIAGVLVLLAGVMASPIRLSSPTSVIDCLRCNFAIPKTTSTRIAVTSVVSRPVLVKGLPAENEEELSRTTPPDWYNIDQSPTLALRPEWVLATPGSDEVFHPLRC